MQGLLRNTPLPWYKTFVLASAVCRSIYAESGIQVITINNRPVRQNKSAVN